MSKTVSFSSSAPLIREMLKEDSVTFVPHGRSMLPLFRDGKDKVTLTAPKGRLKKYDIPLYQRADGKCVLHRVIKVLPDGYAMCGDNGVGLEYGISDKNIIGVVTSFERGGKKYTVSNFAYKLYSRFWVTIRLLRRAYRGIERRIKTKSWR